MSAIARSMTCTGINVTLADLLQQPALLRDPALPLPLTHNKKKRRRRADESAGAAPHHTAESDEAAENGEPS